MNVLEARMKDVAVLILVFMSFMTHAFVYGVEATIKIDDIIRVDVMNEPRVSTPQSVVSKNGDVVLPLLGQVNLKNLTLATASDKVQALYQKDWLTAPKVTVTILKHSEESIFVLGCVHRPGQMRIPPGGLNFSTALSTAGGLNQNADAAKIQLIRADGQKTLHVEHDINHGDSGKIKLLDGDRILVSKELVGNFVTFGGCVTKPGVIPFPIDENFDLVSALAIVGGLSSLADGKIIITRNGKPLTVDYNKILEKGTQSPLLEPGDNIFAKPRHF